VNHELIATKLLTPLWSGIPADYKMKYARSIWQQFEDNIRSAAYTDRLSIWYDVMCRKLGIDVKSADLSVIHECLQIGADEVFLRLLREETAYLVVLVRLANEERKAEIEERKAARHTPTLMFDDDGDCPMINAIEVN
jgi:hypothetical protein